MTNPYDQARDDARSGRPLSPGADSGVYWAERHAAQANQRAKEELERRGSEGTISPGSVPDISPSAPSAPMSPEEARAGLIGCATLPVLVVLAPMFIVLYPAAAIAGLVTGYVAWQVSQMVSPGGGAFTGLIVCLLALIGAVVGLRFEATLARIPGYALVRLPVRLLLFAVLLVNLMLPFGLGMGCLPGGEPGSFGELLTMLRRYYACMFGNTSNLVILAGGTALFALALRNAGLRAKWHRWLRTLGLRAGA